MFTNLQQQYIWWWPATVSSPLKERERKIYLRIHVCRDWYTSSLQQTLDSFHALDYGKESKVFFEHTSEHPCRATNYWLKQSKAMQGRTYCNWKQNTMDGAHQATVHQNYTKFHKQGNMKHQYMLNTGQICTAQLPICKTPCLISWTVRKSCCRHHNSTSAPMQFCSDTLPDWLIGKILLFVVIVSVNHP